MIAPRGTRSSLRLLFGLSCLLIVMTARAEERPDKIIIDDVIPTGNLQVPTKHIVNLIKSKAGNEFKPGVLDEDVRTLLATKKFRDVQVQKQEMPGNKIRLYIIIKEDPSTILEVIYQGHTLLKPEELNSITGLRKGAPHSPMAAQMGRQAILRRYSDMGRRTTEVELVEGGMPGDIRVVFKITEGQIARVKKTSFVGSSFATAERLRSHLRSLRWNVDVSDNFDPERVEQDVYALEAYFHKFGFGDARVRRELIWSEDQHGVEIVFHIDEGKRDQQIEAEPARVGRITIDPSNNHIGEIVRTYEVRDGLHVLGGQVVDSDSLATRDRVIRRQLVPVVPAPFPIP